VNILVLVIEDERADIAIVRESLADTSAGSSQIAYAGSLAEGVQRLAEGGVDIVLLDLSLPDSDGDITLARVREVDPEIPILVIAGTSRDDGPPAGSLAANQFILKDHVECHRLGDIIRTVIRKARGGHAQATAASMGLVGETTAT
jgi:CheY-like chemotaxis protein